MSARRRGHAQHAAHGGAWKVAYADFVTAMMAFFIVMWILGQSPEVQKQVYGYFKDPTGSGEQAGPSPIAGGLPTAMEGPPAPSSLADLEAGVRQALADSPGASELAEQVDFFADPEGLRIELVDRDDSSFFATGSAELTPDAAEVVRAIAAELAAGGFRLKIEGHTDSAPYAPSDVGRSNWALSSARADAARQVMEPLLGPDQIREVVGYADRHLRVSDDPLAASNRRVSILVMDPDRDDTEAEEADRYSGKPLEPLPQPGEVAIDGES